MFHYLDIRIDAQVKVAAVGPSYNRFARSGTWGKLANLPVIYGLTTENAQRSNVAGGSHTNGKTRHLLSNQMDCIAHEIPSAPFQTEICPAIWTSHGCTHFCHPW